MLSKKHNDPFYWKNKLEAGDGLTGDWVTGKDALWERLQARLQKKTAGPRAVWYGIAAGLLPVMIMAILLMNNTKDMQVNEISFQQNDAGTKKDYLLPALQENVTIAVSAPVEKKQAMPGSTEKKMNKVTDNSTKVNDSFAAVTVFTATLSTEKVTGDLQPVDSATNLYGNETSKKKMQVVHINELETAPPEFATPVNYAKNLSGKTRKNKPDNLTITAKPNSIGFKIEFSSKN